MKRQPNSLPSLEAKSAQVLQLLQMGNHVAAQRACRESLTHFPDHPELLFQLALVYVAGDKLVEASAVLSKAIDISRPNAVLHRTLGEVYRRLGRLSEALLHCRQAVCIDGRDSESRYNLGLALANCGRFAQAIEQYSEVLRLSPRHGMAANNMGASFEKLGDDSSAEAAYRLAITISPINAEAQNNLGAILVNKDELSDAAKCFNAAIAAATDFVEAHHNLSGLKTYSQDDKHLDILEGLVANEQLWSAERRVKFWFALAKARHDTKQYMEAFQAYDTANRLHRTTLHYDAASIDAHVDAVTRCYDSEMAAKQGGHDDATPIFIVGMPRSGTTLIEQILASHPNVHGAGELRDFSELLEEVAGAAFHDTYSHWLPHARAEELHRLGCDYVARLRHHDRDSRFITDKMPGNFWLTGIIHLALPNARIIHASRNPIDTCFSNFQTHFKEPMAFAYNLNDLAHYYRAYQKTMSHFESVLPPGNLLTVTYEDLVCDPKSQIMRLLAFVGLDWHDACLAFHETPRKVRTASVAQVRKPIYTSSSGKCRNYEPWLGELITALDDAALPSRSSVLTKS